MLNKRAQTEIDGFLSSVYDFPDEVRVATASAFTQCRDKVSFTAFKEAAEAVVEYFYSNYKFKTFHGFRLLAIDGSVYTLPKTKETIFEFGENVFSKTGSWIKGQISFATDVLNNISVRSKIGPYKDNERVHAKEFVRTIAGNNLFLFDRGYFDKELIKNILELGNGFCFRVKSNACREVADFVKSDHTDIISSICIEGQDIKVRFTKVELDTGEIEYLVTSLFEIKIFTPKKLKELYSLRWGVEEQYKDMKYALCSENFVGKKPNSIKQEFFANILTYNMSMMVFKPAIDQIKKKTKHVYKTNKRALIAKVKQCFVKLFYKMDTLIETIENIIKTVSKESVPIRNDRKYPRGKCEKAKIKHYRAYVSVI